MIQLKSGSAIVNYTSTGRPTVALVVRTASGSEGRAALPLGHSYAPGPGTGKREVQQEVESRIASLITDWNLDNQWEFDERVNKSTEALTDSALRACVRYLFSAAAAQAAAKDRRIPLYEYLAEVAGFDAHRGLPVPVVTVISGGAAATSPFKVQSVMIAPVGIPTMPEAIRAASEIAEALTSVLKSQKKFFALGDEGGLSTAFDGDTSEAVLTNALEAVVSAIEKAGYKPLDQIRIAVDFASAHSRNDDRYELVREGDALSADEIVEVCARTSQSFPLLFIEDPMSAGSRKQLKALRKQIGKDTVIAADDLLDDPSEGVEEGEPWKAVVVKPARIGTLSDTIAFVAKARKEDLIPIISHSSSEVEDALLADLAAAVSAPFIRAGGVSGAERTAKYNQLLRIAEKYSPGHPVLEGLLGGR